MSLLDELLGSRLVSDLQGASWLFKLPAEVRREIYHLVYPEHLLHIEPGPEFKDTELPWPPTHHAFWCFNLTTKSHPRQHICCDWAKKPKKQMLGLPLTCRLLYLETIQCVYSRHHFYSDLSDFLHFGMNVDQIHTDAITMITLWFYHEDDQKLSEYDVKAWDFISNLQNLRKCTIFIENCNISWSMQEQKLRRVMTQVNKVQQMTIRNFDLIFNIEESWFPASGGNKIAPNRLGWTTFIIDKARFQILDGHHPKCRVIGMNGTAHPYPLPEDTPTMNQLISWFNSFPPSPYGLDDPEVSLDEKMGARAMARWGEMAKMMAGNDWPNRKAAGEKQKAALEETYFRGVMGNGDPETWDVEALNHAVFLTEEPVEPEDIEFWIYPDRPGRMHDKDGNLKEEFQPKPKHI